MRSLPNTSGHLKIYKDTGDSLEKLQEYDNIITIGFAVNVVNLLTGNPNNPVENIAPTHCQIGTGVVDYIQGGTSNNFFYELKSALTKAQYGRNQKRKIITKNQITSINNEINPIQENAVTTQSAFLQIPKSSIILKKESGIQVRIIIDKNTANGLTLREIGLFTGDASNPRDKTLALSCYKQFSPIQKTSDYSLIFDWTIQVTDFDAALIWKAEEGYSSTIGSTGSTGGGGRRPNEGGGETTGGGGGRNPELNPPTFYYRYAAGNPNNWDLQYPLTGYTITPFQNPIESFLPGTFGFTAGSLAEATASGFSINPNTGLVSTVGPSPAQNGSGRLYVSASPTRRIFPDVTATLPYEISLGKTTGDGSETYLGQIYWKVPTSATLNTSTVIKCVVPTSAGDFDSSVWGTYTNWLISGVDANSIGAISASGVVAQIHPVQVNPSGGYETVEVIFPTTIVKAPGEYQYYDIYTTSAPLVGTAPSIQTSSFIEFKVADVSGNVYAIDPDLFTSSNLATSSLIKTGPYLTSYKFVYRTKPVPSGTFPDANNIEHRPFGPTVFMYYTFKKYDPMFTVDIRVANGFYMLPNKGWGGTQADGVGAVKQTDTLPQARQILGNFYYSRMWIEQDKALYPILNLSGAAETYAGRLWDSGALGYSKAENSKYRRDLVYPFSTANDEEGLSPWDNSLSFEENIQWNCHVLPKHKHFSRRFIFIPQDTNQELGVGLSSNTKYAFDMVNYGDVAFPVRGRSWYNIPKWGPVGDLAPSLGGLQDGSIFEYQEMWNLTRRPSGEKWSLPGPTLRESFAFLYKIKAEDLELVNSNIDNWNNYYSVNPPSVRTNYFPGGGGANMSVYTDEGIAFQSGFKKAGDYTAITNIPDYGYNLTTPIGSNSTTSKNNHTERVNAIQKTKIPFNTFGRTNPDEGSLEHILLYPGASLTNEELRFMGIKMQYASQRFPWIYDVSGNSLTPKDIMESYGFTSQSAPPTTLLDHFYLLYLGAVLDQNEKEIDGIRYAQINNLPYSIFSWKSNSKIAEPFENVIRADPESAGIGYLSNILSGTSDTSKHLTIKCPYAYKVMPFSTDRILGSNGIKQTDGNASRPPGREHLSRQYPTYIVLSQLTNDQFIKDEFENVASLCALTFPTYPSTVTITALTPNGIPLTAFHNDFTATKYLATVSGSNSSGQGLTFQNTRGTVHPVATMAGYYSFAPSSWKNKVEDSIDYMASGFHYAWIRSNGHIGDSHIDSNGDPDYGGQYKAFYYGHYLSSVPPTSNLRPWFEYSGAFQAPYNALNQNGSFKNSTLVNNLLTSTNKQGNYFDASNLADQAFFMSYQSYAFSILAKHALRYRKPELYSSLTSAISVQASSVLFDVFRPVSGLATVSDVGVYLKKTRDTTFYTYLNNTDYLNGPMMVKFTKNAKVFSGVVNGVNLATANSNQIFDALQTIPDEDMHLYMSPVNTANVIAGIPNIIGTVSDHLTVAPYRGQQKDPTSMVTVPKVTFSGSDYDTKNILGDEVRTLDCHSFFYNGMMADKNWELSALDASNAFILKAPEMGNSYFEIYEKPKCVSALAALPDKTELLDTGLNHYRNLILLGGIHYMAPMIAYLKYVKNGDKNGQGE